MNECFWHEDKRLADLSFVFSEAEIPTWWTQYPQSSNLLTGWCAGPAAEKIKNFSNTEIFEKALISLAAIFNKNISELGNKIGSWKVFNWANDPFSRGGYTYVTVQTKKALQELTKPEAGTIYFAGEGLYNGPEVGTVEAALQSAVEVTKKVVQG